MLLTNQAKHIVLLNDLELPEFLGSEKNSSALRSLLWSAYIEKKERIPDS